MKLCCKQLKLHRLNLLQRNYRSALRTTQALEDCGAANSRVYIIFTYNPVLYVLLGLHTSTKSPDMGCAHPALRSVPGNNLHHSLLLLFHSLDNLKLVPGPIEILPLLVNLKIHVST